MLYAESLTTRNYEEAFWTLLSHASDQSRSIKGLLEVVEKQDGCPRPKLLNRALFTVTSTWQAEGFVDLSQYLCFSSKSLKSYEANSPGFVRNHLSHGFGGDRSLACAA